MLRTNKPIPTLFNHPPLADGFFNLKPMKKILPYLLPSFLAFFCCASVFGQSDSTGNHVQFKLSVNYNSGLNYYGRTDSLKSSGFFPLAEIWFTKDFYVNAAPVFVNNRLTSMDYAGTVTTIGYQHVSSHWLTHLYVSKPFYKSSSELVQSALQAQGGLTLSFLNKIINITGGADLKYSNQADYGATAGLDHIVRISFGDKGTLILDPSITASAGTQNFTNTYYKKTAGFLFFPGSTQQVTQNSQQFNVLAYEGSIPVIYVKDKWQLLITPAYVMPQNLITLAGHPDQSEKGTNLFYVTAGVKYSF